MKRRCLKTRGGGGICTCPLTVKISMDCVIDAAYRFTKERSDKFECRNLKFICKGKVLCSLWKNHTRCTDCIREGGESVENLFTVSMRKVKMMLRSSFQKILAWGNATVCIVNIVIELVLRMELRVRERKAIQWDNSCQVVLRKWTALRNELYIYTDD